jgi:uncharacterized protein (DUF2164 family)
MGVEFPAETKAMLIGRLKSYALDAFDRDIGDLKAERFFEAMVGLIGASAYNQGVADAQAWMGERVVDLSGNLHAEVDWAH